MAVVIVVMVTAGNDFSKDKKFRKLSEIRDEKEITVVRDGEQKSISVSLFYFLFQFIHSYFINYNLTSVGF